MQLLDDRALAGRGIRTSKMQRWRLIRAGRFPKPIKIGHRNFWIESEVNAWLAERIAERDAPKS